MKQRILLLFVLIIMLLTGCSKKPDDVLRVGMDLRFFPFTGMDEDGTPAGVEVDIAHALG